MAFINQIEIVDMSGLFCCRALGVSRFDKLWAFRPQDDQCSSTGILACVMVLEDEPKMPLEASQSMAAISLQFRPGTARNLNTVSPLPVWNGKVRVVTGGRHCSLIEP